jgi:hypothetical protein
VTFSSFKAYAVGEVLRTAVDADGLSTHLPTTTRQATELIFCHASTKEQVVILSTAIVTTIVANHPTIAATCSIIVPISTIVATCSTVGATISTVTLSTAESNPQPLHWWHSSG